MKCFEFSKYSGCGNDFILIDNRTNVFPTQDQALISRLCHRHFGIGADGLILLENSAKADFRMRIFNADGSEAEMCGNGIRCLVKFAEEMGLPIQSALIETMMEVIQTSVYQNNVQICFSSPKEIKWSHSLAVNGEKMTVHHLDTGVPHAVLFVSDLENQNHMAYAPLLRHHPDFSPRGANVNFVSFSKDNSLRIRTYERGVEQETLACGTGAVASALAAAHLHQLESPVEVITRSQEKLVVAFEKGSCGFKKISLAGPASFIFKGQFLI